MLEPGTAGPAPTTDHAALATQLGVGPQECLRVATRALADDLDAPVRRARSLETRP